MNISETWLGVAFSLTAMSFRIGSTRPMPMNAMTQAKATAHTARGWEKNEPDSTGASCVWWACVVTEILPRGLGTLILHRQPMDSRFGGP